MDLLTPDMGLFIWAIITVVAMAILGIVFYKIIKKLKNLSKKLDG